ncbi:SOS (error prone) mutagenesis protein UmuD (RumA) [Legionella londiniensis]|uniref:SOS error prone mutagenesis protein UmuD (RumA) n=1 Tax=Legionella londiniensis TaxID=45068 RepID=A0A0W0VNG4_9GAMM|nr:SOS error prone mutagenesis protein UmuD (RumA) [Legionella londiniensis]STX93363.1 SOS (error prone) mutagenesis protein UmuD (RumA) [Legionella londiniensis]
MSCESRGLRPVKMSLPVWAGYAVKPKIVIAAIDGELTVKRLSCKNGKVQLLAQNPLYQPIDITETQDLVIWGVVTHVIHETQ